MTEFELKHGLSQDEPGPLEPVEAAPKQAPAAPVSTVGDAEDERSPTHGMTLGERIAHVGGRTNAQGYVEFGSPMAVNALIQHVLRDIDCTRQDDDGAYQARYRLPGGQWSSWGHVVCGVKGHEQELRYLPGARRPAPAAGDAQGDAKDAARWRWARAHWGRIVDTYEGNSGVVVSIEIDECRDSGWYTDPDTLDAAIDAALVAQQGEGGGA